MSLLREIIESKSRELPRLRATRWPSGPAPRPVALERPGDEPLRLIAEFKRRSPSAGPLSTALSLADRVGVYERCGAAMISVLCDHRYFEGSYADLLEARRSCNVPLLCKEFVIDECQLDAAVAHGADAVLLIVRCLEDGLLGALMAGCATRGLTPLVEVHTSDEAKRAVDAGATLVGVNARDLDTLEMNVAGAARVLAELPRSITTVHLSGLARAEQVDAVAGGRADAALIGEALMRQDDPGPLLMDLVGAGRRPRSNP